MRTDDLAKFIVRDRSTAYRCLKHLVACDICEKTVVHLENGGYYHLYSAISPELVKKKMKECTENWYRTTCDAIEGFPYDE
jgi:predicted transcriptional regulator